MCRSNEKPQKTMPSTTQIGQAFLTSGPGKWKRALPMRPRIEVTPTEDFFVLRVRSRALGIKQAVAKLDGSELKGYKVEAKFSETCRHEIIIKLN